MKHYYFKYLIGNEGIEIWLKNKDESKPIDLSIYFGEWKTAEYDLAKASETLSVNRNQIAIFFDLEKYANEGVYFWIFHKEYIYCFKGIQLAVFDGTQMYTKTSIEPPKSILAELVEKFKKIDLPEFFSNINSNQFYNRTTIKELIGKEQEIANSLINKTHLNISMERFYEFLSPMQFETLLFQIFNTENSFCSSFRGGTLKDYDLRIVLNKEFHGIPEGKHWIQVKLKKDAQIEIVGYLAYLGISDFENKRIGIDWIRNRTYERKDILNWLEKCVFDNDCLDFEINMSFANQQLNREKELENQVLKKKFLGCMLGGAIGDALGAPIEFLSHTQIQKKYGERGVTDYVEYDNGSGEFTDDTQMTLFTAEGLLRAWHRSVLKGIDGAQTLITFHSYLRWLHTQKVQVNIDNIKNGIYDIEKGWLLKRKELFVSRSPGKTCISALKSGIPGSIDRPINNSKGCGTVMRIAPVGLVYKLDREMAFREAVNISALTHGHPSGYLSGGFLASIIADLANGYNLQTAIKNAIIILRSWDNHNEVLRAVELALEIHKEYLFKDLTHKELEKIGSGWIAEEALAISILCVLHNQHDFAKGVLLSVNHSGDSDSTGAITGNILGLMLGSDKIPNKWKEKLLYHDIVEEMGLDLFIGCKSSTYEVNQEWLEKYPEY
jgi:ADP-ribosylglycohydrolase